MAEKTEKPTKKKLDDARKKGQVAHSPNVPKVMATVGLMEIVLGTRDIWIPHLQGWILHALIYLGLAGDPRHASTPVAVVGVPVLAAAALFSAAALGTAMTLALVGNVMQTGFMVAPEAVLPDPQRIDPIGHLKQMFSMEKVMELVTNVFKVLIIGTCAVYAIYSSFGQLVDMMDGPLERAVEVFLRLLQRTERMSLIAMLLFTALDWAVKKRSFMQQMRMEKQEVEQEQKDQFGDKHIRQHRKKMSKEMMSGSVRERTRRANAVVTNPTHFAVALRYHPDEAPLPVVMARGADEGAHAMIAMAREAGIPIIRCVWLARTLYSVGREDRMVPSIALKATAAVYRAIIEVLERNGGFEQVLEVDAKG
jgi:type III secretion protein U